MKKNLEILTIIKNKFLERHFEESVLFVSIGIIIGVICSGYARIFTFTEELSVHVFSTHTYLIFLAAPLGMLASFFLVRWFSPGSSGSGIPQVLLTIELRDKNLAKKFLGKTIIIVKILSSLIAVFAGAAIGREGPSLQISAAIAHNLGRVAEKFGLKVKMEQLLVAGAASGLAAAFNTPIGGVVYAIEELSKEHVSTFRDVLLLSVVISGLMAQLFLGNYLYLGYPSVPQDHTAWSLGLIICTAFLGGIAGGVFSKLLLSLNSWRADKSVTIQVLLILAVALVIALVFTFLGPQNSYSGKEAINGYLFSTSETFWYTPLTRFFMPLLSSFTGIAGGIFAPSLSAGAALGGTIAEFFDPGLRTILALAGMVAFLTGVTHTPITSFLLVMEMTDRHSVVFPMMLAALASSFAAHLIAKESFYEGAMAAMKKKYLAEKES